MKAPSAMPIVVPADKKPLFKSLTSAPKVAWPTVIIAAVTILSVVVVDVLAVMGMIELWLACLLNMPTYYLFFSVIHDGVHRSISSNAKLNNFIGQAAMTLYAPYADISVFRWAHMEHHRFTNDDGDPDSWAHGAWYTLPFRWMTIDIYYSFRLIKSENKRARELLIGSLPIVAAGILFIIAAIAFGYGLELLMLWLIPSRLAFIGIGFSFFWLPHAHWPDEERNLKQSENLTIATTIREDYPGFFNPILAYQNYHLVHHLWPTTPFYNNEKVWKLMKSEISERDLAVQKGFGIQPEFVMTQTEAQAAKGHTVSA